MRMARSVAAAAVVWGTAWAPARGIESPPTFSGDAQATPMRIEAERVSVEGTVTEVDVEGRQLKIRTSDGRTAILKVVPEVQDLERLRAGDPVHVTLIEPVAVLLHKSDEPLTPSEAVTTVRLVPRGGTPSATVVGTIEVAGRVEGIDRGRRTVTIRSTGMESVRLSVPADDPTFNGLREGDRVVSLYSEGLALAVSKG